MSDDITSWTSLGMNWETPDPLKPEYYEALRLAAIERGRANIDFDIYYHLQDTGFHFDDNADARYRLSDDDNNFISFPFYENSTGLVRSHVMLTSIYKVLSDLLGCYWCDPETFPEPGGEEFEIDFFENNDIIKHVSNKYDITFYDPRDVRLWEIGPTVRGTSDVHLDILSASMRSMYLMINELRWGCIRITNNSYYEKSIVSKAYDVEEEGSLSQTWSQLETEFNTLEWVEESQSYLEEAEYYARAYLDYGWYRGTKKVRRPKLSASGFPTDIERTEIIYAKARKNYETDIFENTLGLTENTWVEFLKNENVSSDTFETTIWDEDAFESNPPALETVRSCVIDQDTNLWFLFKFDGPNGFKFRGEDW